MISTQQTVPNFEAKHGKRTSQILWMYSIVYTFIIYKMCSLHPERGLWWSWVRIEVVHNDSGDHPGILIADYFIPLVD
jgi:hypothetical protein